MATTPGALQSGPGLGTAQRCVQSLWELTRAPSPHCRALRELVQRIDLAARLLQLAAAAMEPHAARDEGEAARGAQSQALVDAMAALGAGGDPGEALRRAAASGAGASASGGTGEAEGGPAAEALFAERLAVAGQACSLATNVIGAGGLAGRQGSGCGWGAGS